MQRGVSSCVCVISKVCIIWTEVGEAYSRLTVSCLARQLWVQHKQMSASGCKVAVEGLGVVREFSICVHIVGRLRSEPCYGVDITNLGLQCGKWGITLFWGMPKGVGSELTVNLPSEVDRVLL